jgi:hypothetical protein
MLRHKNLLGLDVAQYNPDKDSGSSGAKKLVDLLVDVLSARLEPAPAAETEPSAEPASAAAPEPAADTEALPDSHENSSSSGTAA